MPERPFSPGRFGLGGAALGNLFHAVTDTDAEAVLALAWDAGIRYLDTAPHYGLGLSEARIGRFLEGRPREHVVVSTKVGRVLRPVDGPVRGTDLRHGFDVAATHDRVWDFSADGVRRSLDQSLERLGLDRVDLVYLHDPDESPDPVEALRTGTSALAGLRDEGVVDAIGVGSKSAATLRAAARSGAHDVLMVAGRLTLLEWDDELAETCVRTGTGIVAAGVFQSGLLARPWPTTGSRYEYDIAPDDVLERARALAGRCARHGVELPAAALQYPLRHETVRGVVVGAESPAQLRENLDRFADPVPDTLWDELATVPR